jgi:PAS domain S-box-containing protein
MKIPHTRVFRYGIGLGFVAAALGLSLALEPFLHHGFLIFFLSAAMLAGWFGRTGAGLLAVAVSMVLVDYYFIAPYRAFIVEVDELPYLLAFLFSALVTGWLGSARRAAEERQKAHLDELFEQSPEAIMLVDLQDRVLRINREFTDLFGYQVNESTNRNAADLIIPPQHRLEASKNRARLAEGQHVSAETIRHRKDGSTLNVSEVSFPVIVNGKWIAYYVIYRDITESKRALEDLHKAQSELAHLSRITTMGELAASIAHEINQPIGAIVTNGNAAVRWLAQKSVKDAEETLEFIVRDANRAAQVIQRIRSLLAKNPTPKLPLNVNEVVRDVLMLTGYEIHKRDVIVITDLACDLPLVLGDRVQLQQVLLNLLINSFDALSGITDRPRQVKIRSECTRGAVVVQIEDSGNGWDATHENSIFDPFFTTKKDGIGMGLTISRSIVESHGGRLWAEQLSPHGTVLNFTLPMLAGVD